MNLSPFGLIPTIVGMGLAPSVFLRTWPSVNYLLGMLKNLIEIKKHNHEQKLLMNNSG